MLRRGKSGRKSGGSASLTVAQEREACKRKNKALQHQSQLLQLEVHAPVPELTREQSIKMTDIEVNGTTVKALLNSESEQTLVHRKKHNQHHRHHTYMLCAWR